MLKDIDFKNLQKMIDEGYVSVQKHPTEELYIYNYTQKCQFAREWNNETLQCRGLIMDGNGKIIARPFVKFFNYEEHVGQDSVLPPLPNEEFEVYDKLDGSLGILYWIGDEPFLATRGSFTSDQAIEGTKLLRRYEQYFSKLNRKYTYLFEILFPENRIVVDYKGFRDIILIAVVETESGVEKSIEDEHLCFLTARKFGGVSDISKVKEIHRDNAEGFVIRFKPSGIRVKTKYDEYVRLHRLVTGVNAKTIWELLRNGDNFKELLDRVPDEFFKWVEETKKKIIDEYNLAEFVALRDFAETKKLPTRKEQAQYILKIDSEREKKLSGIIFTMLDEGDYSDVIWRMIRPKADKPWKEDQE